MSDHIYKSIELTGTSAISTDDAVKKALARANKTIRNMHWFKVDEVRGQVANGKVAHWQVTVKVGFTLEG